MAKKPLDKVVFPCPYCNGKDTAVVPGTEYLTCHTCNVQYKLDPLSARFVRDTAKDPLPCDTEENGEDTRLSGELFSTRVNIAKALNHVNSAKHVLEYVYEAHPDWNSQNLDDLHKAASTLGFVLAALITLDEDLAKGEEG